VSEDVERQAAAGRSGVNVLVDALEADAARVELIDSVDQVLEAAAQAVEAPHNQRVALPQRGGGLGPARPLAAGTADVVLEDALATSLLQGVSLQLEVLVERADARVTDDHALSQKACGTGFMIHL